MTNNSYFAPPGSSLTNYPMPWLRRKMLLLLKVGLVLYLLACGLLYFFQEKLLLHPAPLAANYVFRFPGPYTERWLTAPDGARLHGVLFKTQARRRGLLFYLHGNAGTVEGWGTFAPTYTALGYDVFLLDYRGFGKSEGRITGQAQLLGDVAAAYETLTREYPESQTVVLGYSLGTGPATWLAAHHRPRLLILQAPYYSLADVGDHLIAPLRLMPGFIRRYPMPTNEWLPRVAAPVVIFHGQNDQTIYPGSSEKLRALLKPGDQVHFLPGVGHYPLNGNPRYEQLIGQVLR